MDISHANSLFCKEGLAKIKFNHSCLLLFMSCCYLFCRVYDVSSGKQTRIYKGTPGDDGTLVRVCFLHHYRFFAKLQIISLLVPVKFSGQTDFRSTTTRLWPDKYT